MHNGQRHILLSAKLAKDYGKGFNVTNLGCMKQFHLLFPNIGALRQELTGWYISCMV
ncbi:conserved hypothetical protein [Treponema primitia ZAS-2]|uniref:YhcG N-terminal domain-containing protein n=1 Tax=Treponema primitia (strain ATCC BAA-887 / DSM 12427 / ZAS-2) TaxID=545694 RepID=F5YPC0_TREPZ|nr:conserved hypothetical protein [Treponema primitia ZAS-2]